MKFGTSLVALASLMGSLSAAGVCQSGPQTFVGSNTTQVVKVQQKSSGFGLTSYTGSTKPVSAVFGKASAGSGFTFGTWGQSFSVNGTGVLGEAKAATGTTRGGAFYSTSNSGTGVLGSACNASSLANCTGVGVHGIVNGLNTNATAGLFEINGSDGGGNILLGIFDGAHVFRVGDTGDVHADGGFYSNGADFAEEFTVAGTPKDYQPGDVLVIDRDSDRRVGRSQEPYSTFVAGIYSTKPGMIGSPHGIDEDASVPEIPMAMVGVVPTKVTTENGQIARGDLLVTSSKAGYAMKGTDRTRMVGAVVGKALQPLERGEGVIQVLVTLQ
jgi:hypothetical protein